MANKKDPAALIYIANYLLATKGMTASESGWFMKLTLMQYELRSLPGDLEELASLADVRFSEFNTFKVSFERTFKHLFERKENGRLFSPMIDDIIQARNAFKESQGDAGRMSVFAKWMREFKTQDENIVSFIKKNTTADELPDKKDIHVFEQLFERKKEQYITNIKNIDGNLFNQKKERHLIDFDNDYILDQMVVQESFYTPEQLAIAKAEFRTSKSLDEDLDIKDYNDVKRHFLNWNRKNRDRIKNTKPNGGEPLPIVSNWG